MNDGLAEELLGVVRQLERLEYRRQLLLSQHSVNSRTLVAETEGQIAKCDAQLRQLRTAVQMVEELPPERPATDTADRPKRNGKKSRRRAG